MNGPARNEDPMARFGALPAGVVHELKNPAAAVRRGADHLEVALARYGEAERAVGSLGLEGDDRLASLADRVRTAIASPRRMDALDRSDAEAGVEEWLAERGVPDPWDLAPVLVELGYDPDGLGALAAGFDTRAFDQVLAWLSAAHEAHALLAEIAEGAERIAEIVGRVGADPDAALIQTVDVNRGLDSTLRVLRGKLEGGIEVRRELAEELPGVPGFAGELNQVWANLLDNAIYAMDGAGTLTLRTRAANGWVEVEVEDDGPGIPADSRDHVFDAYYTTKPPGEGTGLGLHLCHDIVVGRHGGQLTFTSEPGRTTFTVRLPREPMPEGGPA